MRITTDIDIDIDPDGRVRIQVHRVEDAVPGADQGYVRPPATPAVIRRHGGGRRPGLDTTIVRDSVPKWFLSLPPRAAQVVRFVAAHNGVASSQEIRAHLSSTCYDGQQVSPAALGGILGCGGRKLRVHLHGNPWRPLQRNHDGSYSMEPEIVRAVLGTLDQEDSTGTTLEAVPSS